MSCEREFNGRRSPENRAVPAAFIASLVAGRNRIFVRMQDTQVKNQWKLCETITMSLIYVREEREKLRYRTDSKRVAGLWTFSTPGSIDWKKFSFIQRCFPSPEIASCRTFSPAAIQLRKLVAAGEIPDAAQACIAVIYCGNCLSDMKRQIVHMNHCSNWKPVLSVLEN